MLRSRLLSCVMANATMAVADITPNTLDYDPRSLRVEEFPSFDRGLISIAQHGWREIVRRPTGPQTQKLFEELLRFGGGGCISLWVSEFVEAHLNLLPRIYHD